MLGISVDAGMAFGKEQDGGDSSIGKVMYIFRYNSHPTGRSSLFKSSQTERCVTDDMLVAIKVAGQHVSPGEPVLLDISDFWG